MAEASIDLTGSSEEEMFYSSNSEEEMFYSSNSEEEMFCSSSNKNDPDSGDDSVSPSTKKKKKKKKEKKEKKTKPRKKAGSKFPARKKPTRKQDKVDSDYDSSSDYVDDSDRLSKKKKTKPRKKAGSKFPARKKPTRKQDKVDSDYDSSSDYVDDSDSPSTKRKARAHEYGPPPKKKKATARKKGSSKLPARKRATHKLRAIHFRQITSREDHVLRYAAFCADGSASTFADWIRMMKENDHVATDLTKILRGAPYKAFRFETPGVAGNTFHQKQFEFVLVEDKRLGSFAAKEDPDTFAEHLKLDSQADPVPAASVFTNLSGDAMLVAPQDWSGGNADYHGHIAKFMREAPMQQARQVWKTVATELQAALKTSHQSKPLWFSTDGNGVAWLHFRLDSTPKYYRYSQFKEARKKEDESDDEDK